MMKLKKFLLYWRVHAVKRELFCLKIYYNHLIDF